MVRSVVRQHSPERTTWGTAGLLLAIAAILACSAAWVGANIIDNEFVVAITLPIALLLAAAAALFSIGAVRVLKRGVSGSARPIWLSGGTFLAAVAILLVAEDSSKAASIAWFAALLAVLMLGRYVVTATRPERYIDRH
jgi:hypothetical protein